MWVEWVSFIRVAPMGLIAMNPCQGATDDSTEAQIDLDAPIVSGDRVVVDVRFHDSVEGDVRSGVVSRTYGATGGEVVAVDLDGDGEAHVSPESLTTADDALDAVRGGTDA